MRIHDTVMAGLMLLAALNAHGEEPATPETKPFALTPETSLPLHDARDAYVPCSAFVGGNFIVAWQSGRLAPGDLRDGYKFNGDIVGCRIDKSGKVLDSQPFVLCKATDLQERPCAAANNDVALVVWQDLRGGKDWDIYAARIAPDGKVLDPDGFLVSGGAHNQAHPRVAWDGKTFVVVWHDFRSNHKYAVYAARVSADGKVLDADGIKLSTPELSWSCYDPSIASPGDGRSFILWSCSNFGVYQGRWPLAEGYFLVDGKPSKQAYETNGKMEGDEFGHNQPGGGNTPTVMAAGQGAYLLAWRNEHPAGRGNGGVERNAYIFDAQAQRKQTLTLSGARHRITNADLVWDGKAFVAAWTELRTKDDRRFPPYEHIFASRISAEGTLVSPPQLLAGTKSPPADWSYPGGQRGGITPNDREAPAANACVATDGKGTTLIAYEHHPETGEIPIKIGFRILTAP